ncbi:hypothetical protein RhiirA1_220355 [Rhizophagus irregularis]|uniref:Uncharacterized protein n=1 Tax=Rhizophagus irregularis TaxID=588596 RepID=A0A2N0RM86_9GLOM|nr:hypothetical protein RhiirA1_220355 [Rhizophagus irregularis]
MNSKEIEWVFRGCGECDGDRCYQTWRRHQLLKAMQISIFYTRDDIICNAMLRKNNLNTSIIMEFLCTICRKFTFCLFLID